MANLQMFIPITKVDAVQRLVYGVATAEVEDRAKEICDYASTKPYYEKWSDGIAKTTGGKSLGNIRAMHGKVAAGKVTAINFNDDARQIEICAKVVDDAEWNKVLEGVYSGFSQGGAYVRRWADPANKGVFRYTADPNEISLVDLPCVDIATFDCIKADGSVDKVLIKADGSQTTNAGGEGDTTGPENQQASDEPEAVYRAKDGSEHKTKEGAKTHNATLDAGKHPEASKSTLDQIKAKLDTLLGTTSLTPAQTDAEKAAHGAASPYGDVEYADPGYQTDKKKRYPIDTAEHIKAAWSYINTAKNQTPYSSAEVEKIKEKIVSAWKEKIEKEGPPSATDKAFIVNEMTKGLYNIARLSNILEDLVWLQQSCTSEQFWEGAGNSSPLPAALQENIEGLVTTLRAMVLEETEELLTDPADEAVAAMLAMAYAAVPNRFRKSLVDGVKALEKHKATAELLEKVGARHSAADLQRVQKMHDTSVELGAACGSGDGSNTGDAAKHAHGPLAKAQGEIATLAKSLADKTAETEALNKSLGDVLKRVEELEKMPGPFKGRVLAVGKEQDTGGAAPQAGADPIDLADKTIPLLVRANTITDPVQRARFLTNNARGNPGAYGSR